MTHRSIIALVLLAAPFFALRLHADPSSAPAPFLLGPRQAPTPFPKPAKPPKPVRAPKSPNNAHPAGPHSTPSAEPAASPRAVPSPALALHPSPTPRTTSHAASRSTTPPTHLRFAPTPDAWTARTVTSTRLTLELASTGPSHVTTLMSRRVMLTREALVKSRKGFDRTTTLRSLTATRNDLPDPRPAETVLLDRAVGVKLSGSGKITGTIGLAAARDAISDRPQTMDLMDPTQVSPKELAAGSADDDAVKEAWEADSARYTGRKLAPGDVLYFSERLHLPYLSKRALPYFSEVRVVGPVTVNGRAGLALDVFLFSLNMTEVPKGVSPTTGADSAFADWARKSKVHLSFPYSRIRGGGRRVIALDGRGLLDQDVNLEATLTGPLAIEAAGLTTPAVQSVNVRIERSTHQISGPPEPALFTRAGRSAPARGGSRTERPDRPNTP